MYRSIWSFFLILAFCLNSCATRAPITVKTPEEEKEEITELIITEQSPESGYITIIAVGDNLYHAVMIRDGEEGDYETAYEAIRPLTGKADLAFINQETLLAGESFGFSGYPLFNTPQNAGRAIAAAGFNIVSHANNHAMDKGENAILATMDFWDSVPGIHILGIHRSEEQRALPVLIRKNNIIVGFLSYSYGTNGIPVPKDKPYLVSLINTEIMKKEIEALRPLCDFLIVSMHWGDEYRHNPTHTQKTLADFLANHNVDLVIGHHPHVIQPVEYIKRPDGKAMLCFYSLGNFLSAQTRIPTMLGAMAYVKIRSGNGTEHVEIKEAGAIPLVTHYERDFTNFRVYPLYEYSDELAEKHRINRNGMEMTMSYLDTLSAEIFADKEIKQNPFMK